MVDAHRRSPLADLAHPAVSSSALTLREIAFLGQVSIQGTPRAAALTEVIAEALGFSPPVAPNRVTSADATECLWTGERRWLVVTPPGEEAALLARLDAALTRETAVARDLSDARTTIAIAGGAARALLAKGCALDLHPSRFAVGECAQSLLAQVPILLWQHLDEPEFRIAVAAQSAAHLWAWLVDASSEFASHAAGAAAKAQQ
jgi:sarcosine oxidase subunit gamma